MACKKEKKERAANYSKMKECLLVDFVLKRKEIIDCQVSDRETKASKDAAWIRVARDFNACCPNNIVSFN